MTPFVLVITSCLATGGDCARVPMAQGLLELECNYKSMLIVADWKQWHPKRRFVRSRCVRQDRLSLFLNGDEA